MVKREISDNDFFDREWLEALKDRHSRYLIYPTLDTNKQFDVFEWLKAQQILRILCNHQLTSGKTLEFGCGSAGISSFLAAQGYDAHICDLSFAAIKIAKINSMNHAGGDLLRTKIVANAINMPYPDRLFDVVLSFGLLEHFAIKEVNAMLSESVRVLRPGGYFIADIVPGIKSLNIRTIGVILSYVGSLVAYLGGGKFAKARNLHHEYFTPCYESTYSPTFWKKVLERQGLSETKVYVCRLFPPLAIWGKVESLYTLLLKRSIKLQQKFDARQDIFTRKWGWMYLACGYREDGP